MNIKQKPSQKKNETAFVYHLNYRSINPSSPSLTNAKNGL